MNIEWIFSLPCEKYFNLEIKKIIIASMDLHKRNRILYLYIALLKLLCAYEGKN